MKSHTFLPFTLSILALLSLAIGCTNRKADDPRLQEIERIVQVTPTKAQQMLQEILPELGTMSMANRRAWELMSIRVNDKCMQAQVNDSLLSILEDYYEDGTKNERMNVCYYKAAYYRDHGDCVQQLLWLKNAIAAADTTAMDFNADIYLGALAQTTAMLIEAMNFKEALIYAKKMLPMVDKTDDKAGVFSVVAEAYCMNYIDDSAKIYYCKAFDCFVSPQLLKDTLNIRRLTHQSHFFVSTHDSTELRKYMPYLQTIAHSSLQNNAAFELGYYYQGMGQRDSAYYYYKLSAGSSDLISARAAYRCLYEMDREEGHTQDALEHVAMYIALRDSSDEVFERERLLELSRQYDYGLMQASNAELKESAGWRGRINVVLVVAIALLVVLYIVYRRRVNRRIAHLLKKLTSTRDKLLARERELKQLQAQEAALREQTDDLRRNVEKMQHCFDEIRRQREPLMERLRSLVAKKLPMEREDIKALSELLLTEYPEVMQLCRERKLPITTQWIYGLHLLSFSGAQIAILTHNSRQNIHNILARMEGNEEDL